jgi:hypothetical protein
VTPKSHRTWEVVARIDDRAASVPDALRAIAEHMSRHPVLKRALKEPGLFQARIDAPKQPLVLSLQRRDTFTLRVTVRPVDPPLEDPAPTP